MEQYFRSLEEITDTWRGSEGALALARLRIPLLIEPPPAMLYYQWMVVTAFHWLFMNYDVITARFRYDVAFEVALPNSAEIKKLRDRDRRLGAPHGAFRACIRQKGGAMTWLEFDVFVNQTKKELRQMPRDIVWFAYDRHTISRVLPFTRFQPVLLDTDEY